MELFNPIIHTENPSVKTPRPYQKGAPVVDGKKVCNTCNKNKYLIDFYTFRSNFNGARYHFGRCKKCHIEKQIK